VTATLAAPSPSPQLVTISDRQLVQLADLIADRLRPAAAEPARLVTAAELAALLDCDQKTVYRRADELGAIRVGRAVRFDPERALAAAEKGGPREPSERSEAPETPAGTGRKRPTRKPEQRSGYPLLPIGPGRRPREGR
jgi:hypothetical protein